MVTQTGKRSSDNSDQTATRGSEPKPQMMASSGSSSGGVCLTPLACAVMLSFTAGVSLSLVAVAYLDRGASLSMILPNFSESPQVAALVADEHEKEERLPSSLATPAVPNPFSPSPLPLDPLPPPSLLPSVTTPAPPPLPTPAPPPELVVAPPAAAPAAAVAENPSVATTAHTTQGGSAYVAKTKLAMCLVGEARVFTSRLMPPHMHAVLIKPLAGSPKVDLFAHLGGFGGKDANEAKGYLWKFVLAEEKKLLQDNVKLMAGDIASVKKVQVYRSYWQPLPCNETKCRCTGYTFFAKMRNCMDDIEAEEKTSGFTYDFVMRIRPDFEYFRAMPPIREWDRLRRDIVWSWIVTKRQSHPFEGGFTAPFLHKDLLPIEKVDFIDDNMVILPRQVAWKYFHVADGIEKCIPNIPPHTDFNLDQGCKAQKTVNRWSWNECQIEMVLRSVKDMSLTMGMMSDRGFLGRCNFLDCVFHQVCDYPWRRGRGDANHSQSVYLTTTPEQSHFPEAALQPVLV